MSHRQNPSWTVIHHVTPTVSRGGQRDVSRISAHHSAGWYSVVAGAHVAEQPGPLRVAFALAIHQFPCKFSLSGLPLLWYANIGCAGRQKAHVINSNYLFRAHNMWPSRSARRSGRTGSGIGPERAEGCRMKPLTHWSARRTCPLTACRRPPFRHRSCSHCLPSYRRVHTHSPWTQEGHSGYQCALAAWAAFALSVCEQRRGHLLSSDIIPLRTG